MTKILMVCLGNICRSPLAEGLLRSKVNINNIFVDSAGLDKWHVGEAPCKSSQEVARNHGLNIANLRARHFTTADFDQFDQIYIMDDLNHELIMKMARNQEDKNKVDYILNEVFPNENLEVPDSYQKGSNAAEIIYNMLDQATDKIAQKYSDA